MTDVRLFVDAPLYEGAAISATPAQAYYLLTVMRRGPGDAALLCNGVDGEWRAALAIPRRGQASFFVGGRVRAQAAEPGPALLFAPLKRDATDLVVQKATELGAAALHPVLTERTVATRVNLERLRAIATEAAEQSERLTRPVLHPAVPLLTALAQWRGGPIAAAVERSGAARPGAGMAALLVGPEGGFTPAELDVLRSRPFVVAVSLGPLVLRADTAAIAGLAMLGAIGRAS